MTPTTAQKIYQKRMNKVWQPLRYITEADSVLNPRHTPEFMIACIDTTAVLSNFVKHLPD